MKATLSVIYVFVTLLISCSGSLAEGKKQALNNATLFVYGHYDLDGSLKVAHDTTYVLTKKDFDKGLAEKEYIDKATFLVILDLTSSRWYGRTLYFYCDRKGHILNEKDYTPQMPPIESSK